MCKKYKLSSLSINIVYQKAVKTALLILTLLNKTLPTCILSVRENFGKKSRLLRFRNETNRSVPFLSCPTI